MEATDVVLGTGYLLAAPFTVWIPGFLRLWRRREPAVFATAETGAALITVGWLAKRNVGGVALNGLWTLGLAVAYLTEGRKRSRLR